MDTATGLIALRIKGFMSPAVLAEFAGLTSEQARGQLAAWTAEAICEETKIGVRLTALGKAQADAAIRQEREGTDAALMAIHYEAFCQFNGRFKEMVTQWQMREIDGQLTLNDHTDLQHDRRILAALATAHAGITALVQRLAVQVPRLAGYGPRFERALALIGQGQVRYLTAPIIDSYHTVWFELHQDLIHLCGLNRAAEAAAGRAH